MRIRITFTMGVDHEPLKAALLAECPIDMKVHETTVRVMPPIADMGLLVLVTECAVVDPEAMTATPSPLRVRYADTDYEVGTPAPMAVCPEIELLQLRAEEVCGAFSLMFGRKMLRGTGTWIVGPEYDSALVPENEADEAILERLGRPHPEPPGRLVLADTTIGDFDFSGELIGRMAERSGIRVFWEAMSAQSAVSRFRELWRTLELSFGAQGRLLRERLLALPATTELGFGADELADYEVLRGRASHASDRRGHREAALVEHLAWQRIGRLQALVQRVLLTKAEGDDGSGIVIDELIPFRSDRKPKDFNRSPFEEPVRRSPTEQV